MYKQPCKTCGQVFESKYKRIYCSYKCTPSSSVQIPKHILKRYESRITELETENHTLKLIAQQNMREIERMKKNEKV